MKTTNQFDYPTPAVTDYKSFQQPLSPKNSREQQVRYKNVIKQESNEERNKVKQQLQRKKELQNQEQQIRIREEIERKKRELEELEQRKKQTMEKQVQAAELAKIKEELDKIKFAEQEQKNKDNEVNAQFRFKNALRRLELEKEQNNIQERQAQQRRKANNEAEEAGRQQAIKFKEWMKSKEEQEKERMKEQELKQTELMRNGLGRYGLNRMPVDYTKSCLHNPHMIFKSSEEGPTAFERGQSEEQRQQQLQALKVQKYQESRRRSLERGENALQRISREREYQAYSRQTQQQQIEYNLKRVEEGKRNQYVGVKPLTLAQMEANKKNRGEQEFQHMFIGAQTSAYQQPVAAYTIIENRHPLQETISSRQFSSNEGSNYDYSMQNNSTHQKYLQPEEEEQQQEEEKPQALTVQPMRIVSKPMAETRAEDVKPHRQDLYYSQSQEEDSSEI